MRPGTAWMRTVDLLAEGPDEGLTRTRELPINRLIVVCERLIKGAVQRDGQTPRSGSLVRPSVGTAAQLLVSTARAPRPPAT